MMNANATIHAGDGMKAFFDDLRVYPSPGILDLLRAVVLLRLGIFTLLVMAISTIVDPASTLPLTLLSSVVLYLMLTVPWFRRVLGNWYLMAFLIMMFTEVTIVEKVIQLHIRGLDFDYVAALSDPDWGIRICALFVSIFLSDFWTISPSLFGMGAFISLQFRYRHVIAFTVVASALDILFVVFTPGQMESKIFYVFNIIVVRVPVFLIVGYSMTRLMNMQRQQQAELRAAYDRIANYAAVTESLAISRERNRMARELHDTLAHTLSAASVQLEAVNALWDADHAKAHHQLERALDTTRNGLQETRRALQSLRASPLEDLGLLLALRELAETTHTRSGTAVHVQLPDAIPNLPAEVEQTLYRVAQESLENVVRHANAAHARLCLDAQPDTLRLEIADDGRGFDADSIDTDTHFGLRGMIERVSAMGGLLNIDSTPREGTRIALEMALSR